MPTAIRVAKDPDDTDDFVWDWSLRLETGETVASAIVTVDAGAVVTSSHTSTTVAARLSGGAAGSYINATCRMTTSSGRQLDWTLQIPIAGQ